MLSFSRAFATWFRKSKVNMCKHTWNKKTSGKCSGQEFKRMQKLILKHYHCWSTKEGCMPLQIVKMWDSSIINNLIIRNEIKNIGKMGKNHQVVEHALLQSLKFYPCMISLSSFQLLNTVQLHSKFLIPIYPRKSMTRTHISFSKAPHGLIGTSYLIILISGADKHQFLCHQMHLMEHNIRVLELSKLKEILNQTNLIKQGNENFIMITRSNKTFFISKKHKRTSNKQQFDVFFKKSNQDSNAICKSAIHMK